MAQSRVEANERNSQLSQPTEQRSSALGKATDGGQTNKNNRDGFGQIIDFFETFVGDMRAKFQSRGAGHDPLVTKLEGIMGEMKDEFDKITNSLETYDHKLISVLGQHQDDFWFAFKTHMNKIENELQVLQSKSKEQDAKLTQDARIIGLEEQLKWYQIEFKNLMTAKDKNDEQIKHLKDQCKNLSSGSEEMRVNVKAAKRQNKLLGVALQKAENHKAELEGLQDEIEKQTASLKLQTVQMPDLMYSPFLPLSMQLEQQRQLEIMTVSGVNASAISETNYLRKNGGNDESLYRLNSDLPQSQLYQDETVRSIGKQFEVPGTAASNELLSPPIDGSLSPKANQQTQQTPAAEVAQVANSLFDSAEMGGEGSVQRRMESIPEEDASKANLHSSHSKMGQLQHNQSHASMNYPRPIFSADGTTILNQQQFAQMQNNMPFESTVLQQYVKDLVSAGKTEGETLDDLEVYFDTLVKRCDNEIIDLKEELEYEKAAHREQAADEVYLKANEIDELSNVFIDCIHAHRKTLRQQLVKMKFQEHQQDNANNGLSQMNQSRSDLDGGNQKNKRTNLLQTYLRIVKTGAPEEIEKFSQIERQKLVELLVTNQELLNFMFDKMFKNNYDPKEREQMLLSKMTLSDTAFDPGSLEQLQHDDPLELLQRSTELRRAHEQSQTVTKYQRMLKPVGSSGASKTQAFNSKKMTGGLQGESKTPYFQSQAKTQTTAPSGNHEQMQRLMLDRKQRSMAIGVGRSETIDEMTASPLLLQQNAKGERQTLRGYDSLNEAQQMLGSFRQTDKVASDFGKNVFHHLSNVDTDKMQTQFLSNKEVEPAKPSQKSIVLPTIIQRPGAERSMSDATGPITKEQRNVQSSNAQSRTQRSQAQMAPIAGRSKKRIVPGKSARQIRAATNRPLIHIRDGKLLLSGPHPKN